MGIGVSVFLLAVGAILTFAVEVDSTEGFNINTMGIILMIVGGIGLLWSLIVVSSHRRTYVEGGPRRGIYDEPW